MTQTQPTSTLLHCLVARLGRHEPDITDEIERVVKAQRRMELANEAVHVLRPAVALFCDRYEKATSRFTISGWTWGISRARAEPEYRRLLSDGPEQQIVLLVEAEGADNVLPVVISTFEQTYTNARVCMMAMYASVSLMPRVPVGSVPSYTGLGPPMEKFVRQRRLGQKYLTPAVQRRESRTVRQRWPAECPVPRACAS